MFTDTIRTSYWTLYYLPLTHPCIVCIPRPFTTNDLSELCIIFCARRKKPWSINGRRWRCPPDSAIDRRPPLAISDSGINAEGLMSRASKPGSANDTPAGMMHRWNIHASVGARRTLLFVGIALNIEAARSRRGPRGRRLGVIYGSRAAAAPIPDHHPLIPPDRWTGPVRSRDFLWEPLWPSYITALRHRRRIRHRTVLPRDDSKEIGYVLQEHEFYCYFIHTTKTIVGLILLSFYLLRTVKSKISN